MRITITYIIAVTLSANVMACEKTELAPVEAFNAADVIFRGNVENLQYLDDPKTTIIEPRIIVTFKISRVWKGPPEKSLTIHTTYNKSTCNGYAFISGREYLVYASFNRRADNFLARLFAPGKSTLGVKVYGGTKPISQAEKDLEYLEQKIPN